MTAQEKGAHFAAAVASIARSPREQQIIDRAQAVAACAHAVLTALTRSGGKWSTNASHADLALAHACRTHFEQDDLQAVIDTAEHDLGLGDYAPEVATPCLSTEPPCAALHGSVR